MIDYRDLEKTAASIETDGFKDDKDKKLHKTAQALFLLSHLEDEIASGKTSTSLEKQAGFSNKLMKGLAQTALVGLGVAMAGRAADKLEKTYDARMFNKHRNGIIAFAKHENPSLRDVSNGKMKMWLDSAYSVSPKIAKDPMLAATFLNTAHAVGGVDLNTAKTISDINAKGGSEYNTLYDAVRGSSSQLANQLVLN